MIGRADIAGYTSIYPFSDLSLFVGHEIPPEPFADYLVPHQLQHYRNFYHREWKDGMF